MAPSDIRPFVVRVQRVTDGADVDSASFVLSNVTTGGSVPVRSSNKTDSNFAINLADASGVDWTVGDLIKITITKGAKSGGKTHTIQSDEGVWDAGIITITAAGETETFVNPTFASAGAAAIIFAADAGRFAISAWRNQRRKRRN